VLSGACGGCGWNHYAESPQVFRCLRCGSIVSVSDGTSAAAYRPVTGGETKSLSIKASTYNHWMPLHKYAPEHSTDWIPEMAEKWYLEIWIPKVPSIGCSCQSHWKGLTANHPPDFSSAKAFFEWGWARHNEVSDLHSHRPTISLEEAYSIYWVEPKT